MIEITMEGQLEKESERSSFNGLLKSICDEFKLKMEDYDTYVEIEVCPEGTVECSYEGIFISISAQTNVAGPGFHAFAVRLFDAILLQSGIGFEVNDPTQYYEFRDFEALKYRTFYPWLETIAQHIREHQDEDNICICWRVDEYQPLGRKGCVVTPMGYIKIDDFIHWDIEYLAENFFLWNHETRDGSFYRNCALSLLWKECYFDFSLMNEHTDKMATMILDYMEAAYEADSLIDLPYDLYDSLCTTIHREKLLQGMSEAHTSIGYRKELIYYSLPHWRILCDGFCEKTFDRVSQSLNLMAPYASFDQPWIWMISCSEEESVENKGLVERIKESPNTFTIDAIGVQGEGCVEEIEEYSILQCHLWKESDHLFINGVIKEITDVEKIKEWCSRIQHIKMENEEDTKN